MANILLLITGGAIGTLARYGLSGMMHKFFDGVFPVGTLVVNMTGSFIIGLLWGFLGEDNISTSMRTFLFIGILGGFTTFSTFTLETLQLFREGEVKMTLINILANNILGILLVIIGFILARGLFSMLRL
ncbi:MAG: fluoride efflux transporter CrcB [Bacteroidales bacterium]|nr:fluoride efflux transporter CrcB [Bacteroidales bacterium]